MSCAWFREQVGAYVIGALDAADRERMERHLDEPSHEGCLEALAEALETVAALDAALPPARPSDAVWDRIAASIDEDAAPRASARPAVTAPTPIAARRTRRGELLAWSMALAAGVALYFVQQGLQRQLGESQQQLDESRQQLAQLRGAEDERDDCRRSLTLTRTSSETGRAILSLLDRPGTRVVGFQPQDPQATRAAAIVDPSGKAYVVSAALPALPGKDYQLWVIRGSAAPIPAGLVHQQPDGVAIGEFDPKLLAGGAPDALAISLEPTGGSAKPTEVLFVAKL